MVTPLIHLGLGFDDLLVPALVEAGYATKDLILVARTDGNLSWVRRHAPDATVVRLPYQQARNANVVSGLAPHAALQRAADGVGMSIVDLLVSERAVRRNRVDTAMNFLNLAAEQLESVIAGRGPIFALAEFTVTSELLTAGLVTHHGGRALWPRTMRMPAGRFGLWGAPLGITLFRRSVPDPQAEAAAEAALRQWRDQPRRAFDSASTLKVEGARELWRLASDRIRELAVDRGRNLQLPRPSDYPRLAWLNPLKARRNLWEHGRRKWDDVPQRYVFMPLHVQPESSVDVMGQDWRDQPYTARTLADALVGTGITLAVKEHAHFIWRRDPDFWPPFDSHPNIALVSPHLGSGELAAGAVFTLTATGTVGLEGGLRGQPVVSGAQMPWTALGNVAHLARPDDLPEFVATRGWERLHEERERIDDWFVRDYARHSWPGVVLDPPRFPQVLERDNIRTVGRAFAEAIATIEVTAGS
ncbi:MAG TPA: hypothetical protein VFJ97_09480 [Dermatophilaceae bacterium]|nr:hypothetical protein [Dermatophilaceae bacterium]